MSGPTHTEESLLSCFFLTRQVPILGLCFVIFSLGFLLFDEVSATISVEVVVDTGAPVISDN